MMQTVQQNSVGVDLFFTVSAGNKVLDVSSYSKKLLIKAPTGATVEKTPTDVTTGADGRVKYTTIAGDLAQSGLYELQLVIFAGEVSYPSEVEYLKVLPSL